VTQTTSHRTLTPDQLTALDEAGHLGDWTPWLRSEIEAAVLAGRPLSPEGDRVVRRVLDRQRRGKQGRAVSLASGQALAPPLMGRLAGDVKRQFPTTALYERPNFAEVEQAGVQPSSRPFFSSSTFQAVASTANEGAE
jgi:hypothetical protein